MTGNIKNHHLLQILFTLTLTLTLSLCIAQGPGSRLEFNTSGSGQYIQVPHNASLNVDTVVTIEAWIYPTAFAPNQWQNVIVGKDGWGSGEQGFTLRCGGSGVLSFNISAGGTWREVAVPNALALNTWQHVAGVYDGDSLKAYVNGVRVGHTLYTGVIANSTYDVNIGRIPFTAGGTRTFSGRIDEVRLWNHAVTQATLQDWMCRGLQANHPDYSDLMAYYPMNEGTGTTTQDMSPNTNNGTLISSPAWGMSGAAIGDTSVHDYSAPSILQLAMTPGGVLNLNSISGTPQGVQLYHVAGPASNLTPPSGMSALDTTHYWGVFFAGGTNPSGTIDLDYSTNTFLTPTWTCFAELAARDDNADSWADANATRNATMQTLVKTGVGNGEFIAGIGSSHPYALSAGGATSFCLGDNVVLSTASQGGSTYQWYLNGGMIAGATSAQYTASAGGDYYVVVTETPCTYTSDTLTVTVNTPPLVTFAPPTDICINAGNVTFSSGTPTGGTYMGSGVTGNVFDPLIAGPGFQMLSYTYSDSLGCSDTAMALVQVHTPPVVALTNVDLCENSGPFTLTNGSPAGGTYSGTGVSGNTFDPAVAGAGSHPLTYVYSDSIGCSDTATATITVYPTPPMPTISLSGDTLISSASFGNQWYNSSGPIGGAVNQTYVPSVSGTYYVVVTDSNGCISDSSMPVTFVGRLDPAAFALDIYPNPMAEQVQLRWQQSTPGSVVVAVYDLRGKMMLQEVVDAAAGRNHLEIAVHDLARGSYLLRIATPDGVVTRRVVR